MGDQLPVLIQRLTIIQAMMTLPAAPTTHTPCAKGRRHSLVCVELLTDSCRRPSGQTDTLDPIAHQT